ncbi:hypothetical protein ACGF8B_07625 [Streptomyces sp. NPDC047917]|uniref:hypothetical protein n=1 Tax=Streptomyces sp. NPDC047917 TaxID=3365491 RepID=UPI0037197A01
MGHLLSRRACCPFLHPARAPRPKGDVLVAGLSKGGQYIKIAAQPVERHIRDPLESEVPRQSVDPPVHVHQAVGQMAPGDDVAEVELLDQLGKIIGGDTVPARHTRVGHLGDDT